MYEKEIYLIFCVQHKERLKDTENLPALNMKMYKILHKQPLKDIYEFTWTQERGSEARI